ncbi:MAG: PEP-CTERM sorting domain-containing protein, partial [Planctomycetes bacterium]|nr:PEP-CTERM sorting domain-containing protein [Planctomycetota bacterium]
GDIRERHKDVDTAQFHLDGGTLNVTGDIITQRFALGQAAGKTGVYTLASGKNLTTTGTLAVGSSGTGDLTIDGGTLVALNSVIGETATGDGTVTINGGSVTIDGLLKVGNSGIGRINLFDGSLTVTAGGLHLAETTNANAEGILTIGDGTTSPVLSVSGHNFETANNGKGTVTMNSGTFNQLTNNIIVGQGPNSNATFTLNDGLIDIENQLRVGNKGTGLFVQNGGTVNVGTALDLANDGNNDADATYTMTGGALNVGDRVASELVIGNANRAGSTAMFEMIDGTLTTSKGIRIANTGANSSGKMIVGDGSTSPTITINGGNFETADNGTGEVLFNSGTLTLNRNNLMIGQAANSQATFTMNGGLIDLRPAFAAVADHGRLRTNAGTGVFTLNDGTVHVGNDLDLSNNNAGGLTLNINGGEMIVGLHVNYRNNGTDTINLAGGLLDLTGGNVNFATGTADFNFTGGRLQDVGTFGSTLVQGGGTLAPGQMAPGQVAGTMAMTGGYTQNAGVLEIEIGGLDQGNEYDFVDVSGTADLDASLQVLLTGGFDPQLGDSFDVLTAANVNLLAGFTLDQSLLDPSQQYFAYRVIPGGNGQILRLQLVPEPSTIVTAGLGLMALIGLGWRRRRRIAP